MARIWSGALFAATAALVAVGVSVTAVGAVGTPGQRAAVSTKVHPADADLRPAVTPPSTTGTLTQTVQLEIVGGPLTITPHAQTVELVRHGDVVSGTLPDVTVVDARGTLEGWRARVRVTEIVGVDSDGETRRVPLGHVRILPTTPTATAGDAGEVVAGRSTRGGGNRTLLAASRHGGGGTFVGGGTIEIDGTVDFVSATAEVRFSVR